MKTSRNVIALVVMMLAALAIAGAMAPSVYAAQPSTTYVWLTDDGKVNTTDFTGTDYRFFVDVPAYLGLDQEYWNITVYGEWVNNSGYAYLHEGNWKVTTYIYDGATNKTEVSTLAMVVNQTAPTWGNISYDSTDIAAMVANDSSLYYVKLQASNNTVMDGYVTTIVIEETELSAMVFALVPPVLAVVMVCIVLGWMGQIFRKMKDNW